jgi:hypothetical protein
VLAAVSLGLCVATVVLWIASYSVAGMLSMVVRSRYPVELISYDGFVGLNGWHHWAEPFHHRFLGFHFNMPRRDLSSPWLIAIPYWLLTGCTLVFPVVWLRALRSVHVSGSCRMCGCDLRATPDRCPECGAIPQIRPAGTAA